MSEPRRRRRSVASTSPAVFAPEILAAAPEEVTETPVSDQQDEHKVPVRSPSADGETKKRSVPSQSRTFSRPARKPRKKKKSRLPLVLALIFVILALGAAAVLLLFDDLPFDRAASSVPAPMLTPYPKADSTPENAQQDETPATQEPAEKPTQSPAQKPTQEPTQAPTAAPTQTPEAKKTGLAALFDKKDGCAFTFTDGSVCGEAVEEGKTVCTAHYLALLQLK